MKAIWFENGTAQWKELPLPVRKPGESLLQLRVAGICNTDLELLKGYMGFTGVPGHEFVAKVIESDNAELVGQRVVGEINIPCGHCRLCQAGLGNHCPTREVLGISGRPGCFAEFFTLPDANLHPLTGKVRDYDAVLVEPLAAALRVVHQEKLEDPVLVVGDGRLGLLVAFALRHSGIQTFLQGHHTKHMELAKKAGVLRDPGGRYRTVVDCTGSPDALDDILHRVEPTGTIVMKSTFAQNPTVNVSKIVVDEITIRGSRCGPFPEAIEWLDHKETRDMLAAMRHQNFPFEETLEALERASQRGVRKVLIDNLG